MSSIKEIVSHLESELHLLIKPYLNQIDQLKKENETLVSEIRLLRNENNKLQEQFSVINIQETETNSESLLSHIEDMSPFVPLDLIDELFLSPTIDNSYLLLLHCKNFLKQGELDKAHYIIDLFVHNPKPLLHSDQKLQQLTQSIFKQLIEIGRKDIESFEGVIGDILKLLAVLHDTLLMNQMEDYLKDHYSEILDVTLYTNEAKLITDMLKLLMKYDLHVELEEALAHIIDTEWGFLDFNLTKNEFCFFLWYSYLFDLDQSLLDQTQGSTKWLDEPNSPFQLYRFLDQCLEQNQIVDRLRFGDLIHGFKQSNIFTDKEKELILAKIKDDLNPLSNLAQTSPKQVIPQHKGKLYMFQAEVLNQVVAYNKLSLKPMIVPIYQGRSKLISRTIELEIYMTEDSKKGFISDELVDEMERRYYPDQLDVVKYDKIKPTRVASVPQKQPKKKPISEPTTTTTSFQWPSTEIQEHPSTDIHEDQPVLNENSDLKKTGYQITGLTRVKRWDILQQAVPSLGLKKVAYTIAYNIRLRKGQKNGREKYQYAIGEWENDLEKLKKTYYKKDFTWPNF